MYEEKDWRSRPNGKSEKRNGKSEKRNGDGKEGLGETLQDQDRLVKRT